MIPKKLVLVGAKGIKDGLGLDKIEIDFSNFEPGLIALVGDNGVGKSTVMECLQPYLCLASRSGKLQDHFFLRNSIKDLTFSYKGNDYRSLILIDAKTGGIEAYLYKGKENIAQKKALNPDGKVSTYEELIENLLGTQELFFKSIFMGQNYTPFSKLKSHERKKLFMEILGFQRYAKYEGYAKEQADKIEEQIKTKQMILEKYEQEAKELDGKLETLEQIQKRLVENSERIKVIKGEIEQLLQKQAEMNALNQRQTEIRNQYTKLSSNLLELQKKKDQYYEESYKAQITEIELKKSQLHAEYVELERILADKINIQQSIEDNKAKLKEIESEVERAKIKKQEIEKIKTTISEIENEWEQYQKNTIIQGKQIEQEVKELEEKINAQQKILQMKQQVETNLNQLDKIQQDYLQVSEFIEKIQSLQIQREPIFSAYQEQLAQWQKDCQIIKDNLTAKNHLLEITNKEIKDAENSIKLINEVPCKGMTDLTNNCKFLEGAFNAQKDIALLQETYKQLENEIKELKEELKQKEEAKIENEKIKEIDSQIASIMESYNKTFGTVPINQFQKQLAQQIKVLEQWKETKNNIDKADALIKEYEYQYGQKQNLLETYRNEFKAKREEYKNKITAKNEELAIAQKESIVPLSTVTLEQNLRTLIDTQVKQLTTAEATIDNVRKQLEEFDNMLNVIKENARIQLESFIEQEQQLQKEISNCQAQLDPEIELKVLSIEKELLELKKQEEDYQKEQSAIQQEIGQINSKIDYCKKAKLLYEEEYKNSAESIQLLQDWRFVQQACSKDGILALELDSSGSQISNIANDLLTRTFDTTFQIRFVTTEEKKDGSGMKEVFDIKVTKDGEERDIDLLSGGQKVWIEKAIFESIAIYLSQTSDKEYLTNFSDESDGALSPEKKQLYLKMLRESFILGNRYYTILVSQDSSIWKQIQQRIIFKPQQGIEYQF